MGKKIQYSKRVAALTMSATMIFSMVGVLPQDTAKAEPVSDAIANRSIKAEIGDLGQISSLTIQNNRTNSYGKELNFVLPNDTAQQNNEAHQWMGEMIFSYRTSEDGKFADDNSGFVEVDTNKTLAAGGSTTYSNASENLKKNPYIEKKVISDKKVEIDFKGQDLDSAAERTMKGFDVKSVYDTDTDDGSLLWSITLENTSNQYIEFGDVGLPMPWNNKYASIDDTYNNRTTVHTYAGADSGYAYAIRCSGEGNYMLFTPVAESGARIEYIDNWTGDINGVKATRPGSTYENWTSDTGGWFPGLQVYYIHSKDIQKTGRGYYTDATSLVLEPGKSRTYQFKFSAVRAGDNDPQSSAEDENNASDSVEERENNMRSILYKEGMIDAIAVPGFQTAVNMDTKLDLHYDDSKISDVDVEIQCVHENDPWDEAHIPEQQDGLVNNSKSIEHKDGASATLVEEKTVNGEKHHIYNLDFSCIGNNSVRVNYKLNGEEKFTQFEFNVLSELSDTIETHSAFMMNETQDNDPDSPTYGIYSDWYFKDGKDATQQSHWGDDWSHDNINFMAMKNYLNPDVDEIASIEKYLIDFMWNSYMKNTQDSYTVANYLSGSGIYSDAEVPYTRAYSEVMEATGFFNMYRIEKAYPDLMDYRESAQWYLEKAYGIYHNRVDDAPIGFYGEQQIPQMIEALRAEGMQEEAEALQEQFAKNKGTNMSTAAYPYGSEFEYDNTGEEGAYAAAKALRDYYPESTYTAAALSNMEKAEWKTRAMRGLQPTWYQYADPVFRGGETWWNFQYTASLAGSIMDDWLRYEDNGWNSDSRAWAQRMNYAAKLSNFNAVNMGQISSDYIGNVSWRYTMSKGGYGAQNVNDGGSRVMNNGWNDFSGESDEGLYGSLLSISADVVTDPIFGLTGYGSTVSKSGNSYVITPLDGIGKRINVIDSKVYVELEQDSCTKAVIAADGSNVELNVKNVTGTEHLSKVDLSGAGITDGYYSVSVNGETKGQCYVNGNEGNAYAVVPAGEAAQITITRMGEGSNQAPKIYSVKTDEEPQALTGFYTEAEAYDDGAPDGTLTYQWEVLDKPEGSELTIATPERPRTELLADRHGNYVLKLTVSDGELSSEKEVEIQVGKAAEKNAPEITSIEAAQDQINTTTAKLSAKAEADAVYGNELTYEWKVKKQPENGRAIIADADKENAVMKAFAPGSYTLELTVTDPKSTIYDEAMQTSKEITVEMTGNVDGIDRIATVITGAGEKPQLPESITAVDPSGKLVESKITWDDIAESQYEEAGSFEVSGICTENQMKVIAPVMVVKGQKVNAALNAVPTAIVNTPEDLGGVAGLNDGYEPASSRDTSHGVWHNWLGGNQTGDAWVQYDWDEEIVIFQSGAYYFTDGNFAPKSVKYEYLDSNGMWCDVPNAEGCGVELNQYNTTTFTPIRTKAIRMTMSPKTLGCGVIEWKVFGYMDYVTDKTELRRIIEQADALDLTLFTADEEQQSTWKDLIAEAKAVNEDKDAQQDKIDEAAEKLVKMMLSLPTGDGNLAYVAQASTSYVSGWESLDGVNDGIVPENSYSPNIRHYGSWGNASEYETITYTWAAAVELEKAGIYLWYDGEEGDYTSGGILAPKELYYEYLAGDGSWQKVENPSAYDCAMDVMNETTFDPVKTTAIRVTLVKQENDMNGVGVAEWKVYGKAAALDKTQLKAAIEEAKLLTESSYTEDSWSAFAEALAYAEEVMDNADAGEKTVAAAVEKLKTAQNALEKKKDFTKQAAADGICDYVNDLGGLATLNDGFEPVSSTDTAHGVWHNWNDRYDSDGNIQNAWISYTWDKTVLLQSAEAYYFTDNGGIQLPESVSYEYLDEEGAWKPVPGAQNLSCEKDQYNRTEFGRAQVMQQSFNQEDKLDMQAASDGIKTTAIRLVMKPQFMSESDPAHGVGVIEWKVNGRYADGVAPVITGAENGKTYCSPQTITITDNDLKTVTWKAGEEEKEITLSGDGSYIVQPSAEIQTITATDEEGNQTVLTLMVNDGHTGGIADCHTKAECSVCGESYGEFDSSVHTGGTTVKNAKAATTTEEGYTGDTYCKGCDTLLTKGEIIAKLTDNNKDDGSKDNNNNGSQDNGNNNTQGSHEQKGDQTISGSQTTGNNTGSTGQSNTDTKNSQNMNNKKPVSPNSGDQNHMAGWVLVMCIGAVLAAAYGKKRNRFL